MNSWAEQWGDCLVGDIIKLNKRIKKRELKDNEWN